MPLSISISATGLEGMSAKLDTMSNAVDDLSPIAPKLAEIVRDKHLNPLFKSEPSTLIGGQVWGGVYHAPLSRATLLMHPRRRTGQIHIDTGRLWRGAVTEGGEGNRYDVDGTEFTYELTDERAPALQAMRPILFWHKSLRIAMTEAIVTYLLQIWNQ
jgi:hypothetical protein